MPLRVTQSMMTTQMLRNLNYNTSKMNDLQNILSTGRKINKPSDDPVGITYALRYRSELSMNEQYQRNVDFAQSSLDHVDTVLGQVNDVLQRAKELTTQGLNGTNPQDALNAISQEMDQLYQQAVNLGNDQLNGKYIFNGQKSDIKPYDMANADTQDTDTQTNQLQFGVDINIPVTVTGNEVFGASSDADNLFKVLKGLRDAFASGDTNAAQALSGQLDSRFDKVLLARTEIGARTDRVEMLSDQLDSLNLNLQSLDSKTEDADVADTMVQLQTSQNVYQASLSVGAKIIQPSLIDYLK